MHLHILGLKEEYSFSIFIYGPILCPEKTVQSVSTEVSMNAQGILKSQYKYNECLFKWLISVKIITNFCFHV